jgi:hypothetical protein
MLGSVQNGPFSPTKTSTCKPPRNDAAGLLHQTLEQEYNADRTLTQLAEQRLNRQAA